MHTVRDIYCELVERRKLWLEETPFNRNYLFNRRDTVEIDEAYRIELIEPIEEVVKPGATIRTDNLNIYHYIPEVYHHLILKSTPSLSSQSMSISVRTAGGFYVSSLMIDTSIGQRMCLYYCMSFCSDSIRETLWN